MPTVRHTSYFDDDDDEDAYTHSAIKTRAGATSLGPVLELPDGTTRHPAAAATAGSKTKKELNKKYRKLKKDLSDEYATTYKILSHEPWETHDVLMKVTRIKKQLKDEELETKKAFNLLHREEIAANKARPKNAPHVRVEGRDSIHIRRIRDMHSKHSTITGLLDLQEEIEEIAQKYSRGEGDLQLNPVPKDHGNNKYFTKIALDWCFRAIRVIMQSTLQHILKKDVDERARHPRMQEYREASTKAEVILHHMREIRTLVRKGRNPRKRAALVPGLADAGERARSGNASEASTRPGSRASAEGGPDY